MTENKKAKNVLTSARSRDDFLAKLSACDLTIAELKNRICLADSGVTLLLVGSLSQGLASDASDIDIICIATRRDDLAIADGDGLQWKSGAGLTESTLKLYQNGIEFDIEIYTETSLAPLRQATDNLMSLMKNPSAANQVPVLEPHELKFLHELRTGWVLWDEQCYQATTSAFHTAHFPAYCVINSIMEFHEYFEDAASNFGLLDEASVSVMARLSARFACHAMVALNGETNLNEKWIIPLARRIADAKPELKDMIEAGVSLLFPKYEVDSTQTRLYLDQVRAYGESVKALARRHNQYRILLDHFGSQVSYLI